MYPTMLPLLIHRGRRDGLAKGRNAMDEAKRVVGVAGTSCPSFVRTALLMNHDSLDSSGRITDRLVQCLRAIMIDLEVTTATEKSEQ